MQKCDKHLHMSENSSTFAPDIKKAVILPDKKARREQKNKRADWLSLRSGRRDSNSRPPAPKAGILTGLNYYPRLMNNAVIFKSGCKSTAFF